MVWDPARILPQDWGSALAFYRRLEARNDDFRPLRQLVEHAVAQRYAPSLAVATSGTALLVANDAPDWAVDALRVDAHFSGAIRFTFPATPPGGRKTLDCDAAKVVAMFERFLRSAAWVAA
jgi:hypothetical protein